jgi:hypothetical protein
MFMPARDFAIHAADMWKDVSLGGMDANGVEAAERHRMIAVAAYYKAQKRGCAAGGRIGRLKTKIRCSSRVNDDSHSTADPVVTLRARQICADERVQCDALASERAQRHLRTRLIR